MCIRDRQPLGYRVTQTGKTHINPRTVFPFENMGGKNPDRNTSTGFLERLPRAVNLSVCLPVPMNLTRLGIKGMPQPIRRPR